MDKNKGNEQTPLISTETTSIQTINTKSKEQIKWPKPVALLLKFRHKFILAAEPVLLLFTFGMILQNSIYQQYFYNSYGRQLFREELNWTGEFNFCMNADVLDSFLGNDTQLIVTQKSSYLSLINGVAGQLPGIIATILYGPLSDRIGRKPLMIVIGIAGIANSALTILLMYADWPMEILPGINAINGLVGGFPGMLTVVFAYTADVTSTRWLTLRLGVMESMIFVGGALALLLNGQWLNATHCMFPGPEYLYLGSNILMIIYVVAWLPESLTSNQRRERRQNASMLKMSIRGLKLFFSKEYSAWKLWLGVGAMFIGYFQEVGNTEISTLFLLSPPLSWNPDLIGLYQAMALGAFGLALFSLLPLLVVLKVPDPVIMLLGFAWAAGANVGIAFVQVTWQMFLVGGLGGVGVLGFPAIRSIMSKTVNPEDQGALFSVVATAQVLSSVCATILFFFLLPYITINLGWPAGNIFFFVAALCAMTWPFGIVFLVVSRCSRSSGPGLEKQVKQVIEPLASTTEVSAPLTSNALYHGSTPESSVIN